MMKKKTGEGWIFAARLFNKIIITMRQIAEALVYAASLFLPVLFVIGGMNTLYHYVKTHIWLQLWVPIFILLNTFADYQLARIIESALNNPDIPAESLGISFENLETLRTHANLILGYIGAFSWSVPTLAWGLVKGGEYAMSQAVSALGASGAGGQGQKTAHAVGSERGGGGRPEMPSYRSPSYNWTEQSANYGGYQAAMARKLLEQDIFEEFGYSGLKKSSEASMAQGIGTHQGMGGTRGVIETSSASADRKKADLEAFKEEAKNRGYSSPAEFQKDLSTMDYGQKAQVIDDWAQEHGVSQKQAAKDLANMTGDQNFIKAIGFEAGMKTAGGLKGLAELTQTDSQIKTGYMMGGLETLRDYGHTPEEYGGMKGMIDFAKVVGAMNGLKGGKLTRDEIVKAQETGFLSETGINQAIDKVSKTLGMNPKDFQKTLRSWGGINEFMKFSMEQKFADNLGVSYEKLAQYKHGFMELTVPESGLGQFGSEPGGLGDLSGLKADHREAGYESLKKHGYTPESFGGSQGYSEAARIVGEMAHLKGENLSGEEISKSHQTGILSESGLKQAITNAAKTLDMDPKDLNKSLGSWKGVSEFMNFAETQKAAESAGMSLEKLSQYKDNFANMAASTVGKSGKPGAGQGGRYGVAFTPDGKVELKTRRAGSDTRVGDFGTYGHDTTVIDRYARDYQDVDKAGKRFDRETYITPGSAWQMALSGDHALVSELVKNRHNPKKLDAQISAVSSSVGEGAAKFIREQGQFSNYSAASGGIDASKSLIGKGIQKIIGLHGDAGMGVEDRYQKIAQLSTQRADTLVRDTFNEAEKRRFDDYETSTLVMERLQIYAKEGIYKDFQSIEPDARGSMAPIKKVGETVDSLSGHGKIREENPPEFGLMSPR